MKRNKAKSKEAGGKPIEIKRGSIRVMIYTGTKKHVQDGQTYTYPQYSVCYYDGAQRVRKRFSDADEAKEFAANAADKLAKGQNEVLRLTSADSAIYVQARDMLKPVGIPLNVAVAEYIAARKLVPEGTTLSEAARFFAKRNPAALVKRTVEQVVDELLQAKAGVNRSEVHLKDLEGRLTRFVEAFPNYPIGGITGDMIQRFIGSLKTSDRTKLNYLRHIAALFRFAIKRKYLPKDAIDEFEAVEKPDKGQCEVHIFTPAEMREILNVARVELIPFLAIAGFAGLRSAEIVRLDWRDVDLQERLITLAATKTKTGSRRVVPIQDNLFAWLQPHAQEQGPVNPFASWWNEVADIADAVNEARKASGKHGKFAWKHNGLRHSYCSYRLAVTADVARVSYEAGNSPAMIHEHYKSLVSEKQGKEWFAIIPDRQRNIIPLAVNSVAVGA